MSGLRITGGRALLPAGFTDAEVAVDDGLIATRATGSILDATGLLVLPGMVDIHGDAFERQLHPRPGVGFPAAVALRDTEAQLLANGITTAYHGMTLSWEPGLRGLDAWRALLDALAAGRWVCDMRVHLRWEAFNLAALDQAVADIAAGRVHLLAFNDHTPDILRQLGDPARARKFSDRAGVDAAGFRALAEAAAARADEVPAGLARIAAAARARGIPIASHDDDTAATRAGFRDLGARICEFPVAAEVAQGAHAAGDVVVMGSPNVVRGGSHLGWISAGAMAEARICTVLASDYFYPAMLQAVFALADRGALDLADAWRLVSANPAAAAGLADRGTIAPGRRADLVLVDPAARRVVATIAGGRIAHLGAAGAARLRPG